MNDQQFQTPTIQQMQYIGPRLRGQQTQFTQWQIYPLTSNQFWDTNSLIKIQSNTNVGVVDWYRSHIEFQVQVTPQMMPVGGVQVDSSAFGAIAQIVITHQNFQVQRIMQFDTLMAYLVDVNFSQWVCQNRQGQGLGYSNIQTSSPLSNATPLVQRHQVPLGSDTNAPIANTQQFDYFEYSNINAYSPTIMPVITTTGVGNRNFGSPASNYASSNLFMGGTIPSHQSITNMTILPQFTANGQYAKKLAYTGRAHNVRSQYKYHVLKNQYPDTPDSLPLHCPFVKNQTWTYANMKNQGYSPNSLYQLSFPITSKNPASLSQLDSQWGTLQGCGVQGYSKPLCPQFAVGCFQPLISPTIPQLQMQNGIILNTPIPIRKKRFRIPLASSICGIMIPPDQFRLFPTAFYQNLLLQINMNPYWMFSTGYSDVHQLDKVGMTVPIPRKWRYNQLKWVWHIYQLNDIDLKRYIDAVMYKPITFSSRIWQLLCQNQIPNGSYIKQTTIIPCNFQSLATVLILYISNQYQSYPFCRKQFRLSQNVSQLQFKANTVYYPMQPIVGNAGNPQTVDQTGDNWNFYQLILLSNGYLFSTNTPLPRINTKNFAINGRFYDPSNKLTLYPQSLIPPVGIPNTTNLWNLTLNNMNPDTAMGQSWFHQNRYVGRGAYVYSFQPYGHSKTSITGVNTLGWKQFQATFNNIPTNQFPTDSTQYVFGQANIIVVLQVKAPMRVIGL